MTIVAVSGAAGNWIDGSAWVGGVAPTAADDAQIGSGTTSIVITTGAVCRSADFTGFTGTVTGTAILTIGDATAGLGNIALKLVSGMTTSAFSPIFVSTSTTQQSITFAGKTLSNMIINGAGSSYLQVGTIALNGGTGLTLTAGALDCNNNNVSIVNGLFTSTGAATRSLTMGTGTWGFSTAASTFWNVSASLTLSAASSIISLTLANGNNRAFNGAGLTYGTLNYTVAGSTGSLELIGNNTFTTLNFSDATNGRSLRFTAGSTTTITNFNIQGTAGKIMTIASVTASGHTISVASGRLFLKYLSISRSTATGGAKFYALDSTDGGNNSGWNINPKGPFPMYLNA